MVEPYGGPAQPSPTLGQCLNGGYVWMEIECKRCKTRASIPLDAIRRPFTCSCSEHNLENFVALNRRLLMWRSSGAIK